MSRSIGTVASQVFLNDQLCPVALIVQVFKARECRISNIHYLCILNLQLILHLMMTHTNQDEGADFERKASNSDAKRKEEVN